MPEAQNVEPIGIVVAVRPQRVQVRVGERDYACELRRGLLQGARLQRNRIVVGDRVRLAPEGEGRGVLREILPRATKISRVDSLRPPREHVIAANVGQLLALQAVDRPAFNPRALDRTLVLGEAGGVRCAIGLNKTDLTGGADPQALIEPYRRIGYPVFLICALRGHGIEELSVFLSGQTTIFVGPSGAGKSTLLNRLIPGLQLRTGEVSSSTRRGIHTTTRVDYLDLPGGGTVLDTPGLRSVQPWTLPETLAAWFPEMRPLLGACRFRDCLHRTEPGCAVRAAMDAGEILAARHASYVRILDSLLADETLEVEGAGSEGE